MIQHEYQPKHLHIISHKYFVNTLSTHIRCQLFPPSLISHGVLSSHVVNLDSLQYAVMPLMGHLWLRWKQPAINIYIITYKKENTDKIATIMKYRIEVKESHCDFSHWPQEDVGCPAIHGIPEEFISFHQKSHWNLWVVMMPPVMTKLASR